MNNVIFGSGVVGMLAKVLLGSSWKVVPFYKSRFFSFNPALDDNFIVRHDKLDDFVRDASRTQPRTFAYKKAWSVGGQLIPTFNKDLCHDWHSKLFNNQIPPHSEMLHAAGSMTQFIYDVRLNQLYATLLQTHDQELKEEVAKGQVTEIGDHYFVRNGVKEEFDNAVSTIPLNGLCKLMGVKGLELPSKPLHYLHVQTDALDFEGNNQTLVVDRLFSFFKVTNVAPGRYLFYLHEELANPGTYLMSFLKSFDILDGTSIEHALPMGAPPKLDWLEKLGVFCIGSYAQWDWCMDVGSCLLRLIAHSQRGFKSAKREIVL